MFAKQISVLIEFKKGRLVELTSLLAQNGVDLLALSLADNVDFTMVRAIVDDPDKALGILQGSGYTAKLTDVLAVAVPDAPGGLSSVLQILRDNDIAILYLYSLVRRVGSQAVIIFRVEEDQKALAMFEKENITVLSQEALSKADG